MDLFRQGGPVRAAATWLHHVKINRDLESAWPLAHPDYRTFLVDTWLGVHRESPELEDQDPSRLRECLLTDQQPAPCLPRNSSWDQFALTTLAALDELWATIVGEHSGWGTEQRLIAPGHESVVLFDRATEDPVQLAEPTPLRAIAFEVKGKDGSWLVSNVAASGS